MPASIQSVLLKDQKLGMVARRGLIALIKDKSFESGASPETERVCPKNALSIKCAAHFAANHRVQRPSKCRFKTK